MLLPTQSQSKDKKLRLFLPYINISLWVWLDQSGLVMLLVVVMLMLLTYSFTGIEGSLSSSCCVPPSSDVQSLNLRDRQQCKSHCWMYMDTHSLITQFFESMHECWSSWKLGSRSSSCDHNCYDDSIAYHQQKEMEREGWREEEGTEGERGIQGGREGQRVYREREERGGEREGGEW